MAKQMSSRSTMSRAFTLVELLVVILILAILMAVALPLYLDSVRSASKKACRANMHSVSNAAQAWKVRKRYPDFGVLQIHLDLVGDIGTIPQCPDGGAYTQVAEEGQTKDAKGNTITVPTDGFGIECSSGDHNGFVPGVSHE